MHIIRLLLCSSKYCFLYMPYHVPKFIRVISTLILSRYKLRNLFSFTITSFGSLAWQTSFSRTVCSSINGSSLRRTNFKCILGSFFIINWCKLYMSSTSKNQKAKTKKEEKTLKSNLKHQHLPMLNRFLTLQILF